MSDHQEYPPPGAPPPGSGTPSAPPPGYQPPPPQPSWPPPAQQTPSYPPSTQSHLQQPYPSYQPVPGMLGAAHKPGAIPLRPLGLGDMYDGAFRIIRFNPKATVGAAVLVAAVTMAIPILITALLTFTVGVAVDEGGEFDDAASTSETIGAVGSYLSLFGGLFLLQIGMIFVTGMIAHVAHTAAVGRRLTLGEAWAATRGKRWKLLGLTLLLNVGFLVMMIAFVVLWLPVLLTDSTGLAVLWGILLGVAFVATSCWFWTRLYLLPAAALMLEDVGVFGALRRAYRLTRQQFWRTFGIAFLTYLVASVIGQVFGFVIGMVGGVAMIAFPSGAMLALVISQALAVAVQMAFMTPFTSTVAALQYLDQRMRKEAYDVELMTKAGITAR